jgi:signal transduction histidine kinase
MRIRRVLVTDIVLALAFTVVTQLEIWIGPLGQLGDSVSGSRPALAVLALAYSAALAVRRLLPLVAVSVVSAIFALHGLLGLTSEHPGELNLLAAFLAEIVIIYTAAAHTSGRRTYAAGAILVTGQLVGYGPTLGSGGLQQAFGEWVFFALAWALGKTLRWRQLRGDRLEARTIELETAREQQVRQAVAEERAQIARELHDVVAHSVSLMVLQAGAARQALDQKPERAIESLLSVEATGRSAMSELRRLLGILRKPGEVGDPTPQPSLRHLDLLVAQMQEAGVQVELELLGGEEAPPGVDLAAYRIVQEGLTNVLKHSAPCHAWVKVRFGPAAVEVTVENDGTPRDASNRNGTGHGLIGMRERATLYGGTLEAGPRPGGGFSVRARLPFESS